MQRKGFDSEKYIEEQSKYILERIRHENSQRLYLEFGGKLVHDKHAMRVLPGFDENAKIKLHALSQSRRKSSSAFMRATSSTARRARISASPMISKFSASSTFSESTI